MRPELKGFGLRVMIGRGVGLAVYFRAAGHSGNLVLRLVQELRVEGSRFDG